WYETGQSNVTALAFDSQGRLLAGTEPNGLLYRITAKGKAFVLYDAALPEIRSIVPAADGSLYAVAMGGSLMRGAATPQVSGGLLPGPGGAPSISVTVTGEAAQSGVEIKPKPEAPKPGAIAPAATQPPAAPIEQFGVEKSAVYRIMPDNSVETIWSSKEENAYDALAPGGRLTIATDGQGRLYRFDERRATLMAETGESELLRLLMTPAGLVAATGSPGKLVRLSSALVAEGVYESPVHDAGNFARWGRLSWTAQPCEGCAVAFRTRSGNSARPDGTWSEWSAPLSASDSAVTSPNARFVQWKAEFRGAAGAGPGLDAVRLAYLPQNRPPSVKSITVTAQTAPAAPATGVAAAAPVYSVTVTDTGEMTSGSVGTATQPVTRASQDQIVIAWQAEDTDQDRLTYTIAFRLDGETGWIDLRSGVTDSSVTLDGQALADGRYFFRVEASDRASNSAQTARTDELISAPILVDHTPPVVLMSPARGGEVEWEAVDALSPLKSCEYSIDAGPWTGVDAADGVIDSPRERFRLRLNAAGRALVVRVTDLAGNAGLARVVIR
ncbi:MAG: hypothetical protein ACRD44_18845, partial [Bryobacteraceae bacterium]